MYESSLESGSVNYRANVDIYPPGVGQGRIDLAGAGAMRASKSRSHRTSALLQASRGLLGRYIAVSSSAQEDIIFKSS